MFARNLFHTDRKSKEELPAEIWMIDNEYRWSFKYLLEFSPWNLGEDETNLTSIFFRWVGSPTSHFLRYIMIHPGAWSLWIGNFHGFGMFLFQTKQGKTMEVQKHQQALSVQFQLPHGVSGVSKGYLLATWSSVHEDVNERLGCVWKCFRKEKVSHWNNCTWIWVRMFLAGGFKYVLFSSLPGEMIQFD